ncbi:MAG: hypothetical protein M3N41_10200, partial [Acidobacteriota bacterium]|nr:hypothetical protein [Acidobacteriota bacterium]
QQPAPTQAPEIPTITNSPTPPPRPAPPAGVAAGPEALDALKSGRKSTALKYDAADVLKGLPGKGAEGRQVFDRAIWSRDAGIEHLREVARLAPEQMPMIGRAYLEEIVGTNSVEGLNKGPGMFKKWENLGPETKLLLFKNPLLIKDLDSFFLLAKKAAADVNPSNTAAVLTLNTLVTGGAFWLHPAVGAAELLTPALISKLLHSKAGVNALTNGLKIRAGSGAASAFAAARILKLAGDASQRLTDARLPQAAQVDSQSQNGTPTLAAALQ